MRNLSVPPFAEADEIWITSARRNSVGESLRAIPEVGDQWVFVAIEPTRSWFPRSTSASAIGRTRATFSWNLYERISGRTQITTDGLTHYTAAVPVFGLDVDFAQL